MPASLATLSVGLTNEPAIAAAKATGQAFEEMGVKGERAALKLVGSSNSVADALKKQAAAAAAAGTQLSQSNTQAITDLDRLTAAGTRAEQATTRLAGAHVTARDSLGRFTSGMGAAGQSFEDFGSSLPKTTAHLTDSSRAMTIMQMRAIEMNEAVDKGNTHLGFWDSILQKATHHSGEHTVGIGKLERGFEEMSVKAIGANRVVGLLGATMLKFGVGTIETVGILGGIALITYAWDKLTESIHAADKAQAEAAASALNSLRAHVGGPGGAFADQMTGAIGSSQDIAQEIKQKSSFWEALKSGSFMSFNLNPSDRQEQVTNLQIGKDQLDLAVKWLKVQKDLADAKQYANSVTTPYDRAVSRGTSISGFYTEAMAAEAKLTELAKSGTFEVRDAAIQALGALDKIVTQHKLISIGLATAPHQISGIESDAFLGGARREMGDLRSGIASAALHGADVGSFAGQISALGGTLDKARPTDLADITALTTLRDDILLLGDAARMANAKTSGDQERIAGVIRNRTGFTSMAGPLANADAQKTYGDELARREAALKLPAVFDAVREASLHLAEGLRAARQKVSGGIQNWKPGNIGTGVETGVTDAVGSALSQFSPQAIAASLASKAIDFAVQGLTDMAASLLGVGASATAARLAQRQLTDEYNAAVAAFRHDDLAAALAQNLATYDQLLKQTNDTLGNISTLIHGGADAFNAYKKAIADLSEQAKRNAALATQQAAEQKQYALEDLRVRNLRATGRGAEADRVAFQEKQAREMQAAREKALADGVIDLNEKLYLQTLATTQNSELIAFQNGLLTDALRNAPTGFYAEQYIGAYATPRSSPAGSGPDQQTPYTGSGTTYGGGTGVATQAPKFTLVFQPGAFKQDKDGAVNVLLEKIDVHVAATQGAGGSRSAGLDTMTRR